LIRAPRHRHWQ